MHPYTRKVELSRVQHNNHYNSKSQDNNKGNGNKLEHKKGMPGSPLYKNHPILCHQNLEMHFQAVHLAMKLQEEQLKKDGKMDAQVNKLTKESLISAFGVTQDHMLEPAKIL